MTDKFFLAGMGAIAMVSHRSGMSNEGRRTIDSTLAVMLRDFRQALKERDEINHFLLRKNAEMLDRLIDLND